MEVKLSKANISYYYKALGIEFSREETAENIVPDTLPDVAEIVDADGMAILRGKDFSEGRISVSGMIFGYIIYRSEEGQLRRMPVQLPFSAHWDNASISQSCRSAVKLSISSFEGRIINSRKLLLRAEVSIAADIYQAVSCEYTDGVEDSQLELLNESITFSHVSAVGERTFTISEELQMPSSKPMIRNIMKYRVKLYCNEVKAVGSRIVVKGNAQLYVVYNGDNEEVCAAEFDIPFSQIYDTDCKGDITASNAVLMMTGIYLDANEAADEPSAQIKIEIGVVAQFCAWSESCVNCLCDAYSTRSEISMSLCSMKIKESKIGESTENSISVLVGTPAQPKSIVDAYAYTGKPRIENGECCWPITARVLYESEDGNIRSATGGAEFKCGADIRANYSADIREVAVKTVSGGIELRVPVNCFAVNEEEIGFATPEALSIDEDEKDIISQPSVVVLKADGNSTLWSIAKQFNTTIAAINEANPGIDAGIPEKGTLLLIAKKR